MLKKLLEIVLVIALFIWASFTKDTNLQAELYGMVIGGSAILIIDGIVFIYNERAFLNLYWDCFKPFVRPELRLTIAYLYRIEMNGKYLLVKSKRLHNTYQPVGGVYKYYNPEAKLELDKIGAITCNKVGNDDVSEFDLRLNLTNRNKIIRFLKWFFKAEKREIDPWREFYEELVSTEILPAKAFTYIHYELVGQHFEQIHWDEFFEINTFKYADIYVPKFINARQIEEVKKLLSHSSDEYIWATRKEIMQGKSTRNELIAEHSYKIFHNKKLKQ